MALGDDYITLPELKGRLGIGDAVDDVTLSSAIKAASRGVDHFCRRQFNKTTTASARTYHPSHSRLAMVHDFHTTTDLVVATGDDGAFDTTWSATDFQLEPLDGIVDGVEGFPFWKVRAVENQLFPMARRATVQITAQWGWDAVPSPVVEATFIVAQDIARLKDTPFGVGGFAEFGRIRARENPHASMQLMPYRRNAVRVA
jgi:hypothetical protein